MRYPAIGKLNRMGIRYRPSLRYKIHSREANILKNPDLDIVMAQVDTNLNANQIKKPRDESGMIKSPVRMKKRTKSLIAPRLRRQSRAPTR